MLPPWRLADGTRIVAKTALLGVHSWDAIKARRSPPAPIRRRPTASGRPSAPTASSASGPTAPMSAQRALAICDDRPPCGATSGLAGVRASQPAGPGGTRGPTSPNERIRLTGAVSAFFALLAIIAAGPVTDRSCSAFARALFWEDDRVARRSQFAFRRQWDRQTPNGRSRRSRPATPSSPVSPRKGCASTAEGDRRARLKENWVTRAARRGHPKAWTFSDLNCRADRPAAAPAREGEQSRSGSGADLFDLGGLLANQIYYPLSSGPMGWLFVTGVGGFSAFGLAVVLGLGASGSQADGNAWAVGLVIAVFGIACLIGNYYFYAELASTSRVW